MRISPRYMFVSTSIFPTCTWNMSQDHSVFQNGSSFSLIFRIALYLCLNVCYVTVFHRMYDCCPKFSYIIHGRVHKRARNLPLPFSFMHLKDLVKNRIPLFCVLCSFFILFMDWIFFIFVCFVLVLLHCLYMYVAVCWLKLGVNHAI